MGAYFGITTAEDLGYIRGEGVPVPQVPSSGSLPVLLFGLNPLNPLNPKP